MSFLGQVFIFLVAALAIVPLLHRLGLSSVIGYLLAGVLIGPSGFALINGSGEVLHFAEYGIILLLYIIGLELQPKRLWVMRGAVFGLGSLQIIVTSAILFLALLALKFSVSAALLLGFSLALSSTAFVLQLLGEKKELNYAHGRAAFGVLLFQDMAVIPVIAFLSIAGAEGSGLKLTAIAAVIAGLILARFLLRPLLHIVAATGIHELFIAASLAIVCGFSLAMQMAGLSMGLGAFIAGMLVADSEYRHQLETDVMPFKGLLLGLFFIAVGMSANLALIVQTPLTIIGLTVGLIAIKILVMIPLGIIYGLDKNSLLRTAVILSQGGEFAFVLLTIAARGALISEPHMETAVLVVTLSMATTPFLVNGLERLLATAKDDRPFDAMPSASPAVIIAGFGRFGQMIGRILSTQQISYTALDSNPMQVDLVREFGNEAYFGDATRLDLLKNAGIADANAIVIALNNVEASVKLVETLRESYPNLTIFARAKNRQHEIKLRGLGAHQVIRDTLLSSLYLAETLLTSIGRSPEDAADIVARFKEHDKRTIEKQAAVVHDMNAFKQTSMDAAAELKQLFLDDKKSSSEAKIE